MAGSAGFRAVGCGVFYIGGVCEGNEAGGIERERERCKEFLRKR